MYYSGSAGAIKGRKLVAEPELVLGDKANIMLSYHLITKKQQDQHLRWPEIKRVRKQRRKQSAHQS